MGINLSGYIQGKLKKFEDTVAQNAIKYGAPVANELQSDFHSAFDPIIQSGQMALQAPAPLQFNQGQIQNPVLRGIVNTPGNLFKDYANTPLYIPQGVGQTAQNLYKSFQGQHVSPQKYIADASPIAHGALNLLTAGQGQSQLENLGNQGFWPTVKTAAGSGLKVGSGYGAVNAAESGENINDPLEYFKNAASKILVGGGTGALVAGGLAATGYGIKKGMGKLVEMNNERGEADFNAPVGKNDPYQLSPEMKIDNELQKAVVAKDFKKIDKLFAQLPDEVKRAKPLQAFQAEAYFQDATPEALNSAKKVIYSMPESELKQTYIEQLASRLDRLNNPVRQLPEVNDELMKLQETYAKMTDHMKSTKTGEFMRNKIAELQSSSGGDVANGSLYDNSQAGFMDPNAEISNPFSGGVKKLKAILSGDQLTDVTDPKQQADLAKELDVQRGLTGSVKETKGIKLKTKNLVNETYQPKPNSQLMGEAKALLSDGATIDFKHTENLDQKVAATIQEALNLDKSGDHEAAAALFNNLSIHGTELGRGVQAFSMLDRMSPESIAMSAAGKINKYNQTATRKLPPLTGDQQQLISDSVEAIRRLPEGREKNIAINELSTKINEFIPSSLVDKFVTVWKAGLLTSLRTHERNLLSNSIMGGSEVAKDIPASLADKAMGLVTGNRSMSFTTQGTGEGTMQGLQSGKDIISMGYDPEDAISKYDVRHITWGKGNVQQALKKYTDVVFNTLGAEDKPFWNASYARSLYDQAGAEAMNAGKQGDQTFIEQLVKAPTDEMAKAAIKDANIATFHDQGTLASVANAIKKQLSKYEVTKLGGELFAPFTGVPSSVTGSFVTKYSPIGLVKGIVDAGKVTIGNMPELQRQASQEIGRGVIGTGLITLGAYLYNKGLISGQPKDATEARQWQLEGKQANSLLIGGKWRAIGSIGPQNLAMLAGAKWQEEMNQPDASVGRFAASVGKDILAQTFLQGVQQPLAAITDPKQYGQSYLGNQVSSLVPNAIKDMGKSSDSFVRENNSIPDYVKNSLPIVRNSGIVKRDALGNPIPQEPTGAGAFLDLFNSKTPSIDPVVLELSRLNKAGNNATPSKLGKSQTIKGVKTTLTPNQLDVLESTMGPKARDMLKQLIESPNYKGLSDEDKAQTIDTLMTKIRKEVRGSIDLSHVPEKSASAVFAQSSDAPQNIIDRVVLAARGIGVDPENTIKAIFTEERMRKISGNALILERKQGLNKTSDKNDVRDHIIPVGIGGDNAESNLRYVPKAEAEKRDVLEKTLARQLAAGQITKEDARKQIQDWVETTPVAPTPTSAAKPQEQITYVDPQGNVKTIHPQEYARQVLDEKYKLTVDRAKRANHYDAWKMATEAYIGRLKQDQSALTGPYDEKQSVAIQHKIEDLQTQIATYDKKGGFKKWLKAKKGKLYKAHVPKFGKIASSKPKYTKIKLKKFKLLKSPKMGKLKVK